MTQHKNIAEALCAAQAEMGRAVKDSTNPHFKTKYADLSSVQDACMPALSKHGIAVAQTMTTTETGEMYLVTKFLHGEQELSCPIPLILGKRDMQGLGSAITYARRYGLMGLAGIAPDDDDGNAAVASAPRGNPTSEALGDAWKDGILDKLPENASPRVKAEAFAAQICADFFSKGRKALDNEWDRRKKIIDHLKSTYPDLHGQVVDAYENRKNELEPTAADYIGTG